MRILNYILVFCSLSFVSCNSDDNGDSVNPDQNNKSNSVLIINEGGFGNSNGTITEINLENEQIEHDVIGKANNGISSGDVIQSVYRYDGKLYLVSNGDNKIRIFNESDYVQTGVIESNLASPRYMLIHNSKIYVTNWNSDFNTGITESFVSVFDLNTLEFIKKIDTDDGTEKIHFDNERFWVTNYLSNTVEIFKEESTSIESSIEVFQGPNGIVEMDEEIVVLCQGSFGGNSGFLYQFDKSTLSKTDSFAINSGLNGHLIKGPDDKFYYSANLRIFASSFESGIDLSADELSISSTEITFLYGMGVQSNGNIWIADAGDFSTAGKVHQFDSNGELLKSYSSGIAPNGFLFY